MSVWNPIEVATVIRRACGMPNREVEIKQYSDPTYLTLDFDCDIREMAQANELASVLHRAADELIKLAAQLWPAKPAKASLKPKRKGKAQRTRGPDRPKQAKRPRGLGLFDFSPPVKRRPGRPKKSKNATPPVKRGPGRPKKTTTGEL